MDVSVRCVARAACGLLFCEREGVFSLGGGRRLRSQLALRCALTAPRHALLRTTMGTS